MKLKQVILLGAMLQTISPLHASDMISNMTTATTNLYNAQAYLASLLGVPTLKPIVSQPSTTMIINNDAETIFLALFNENSQRINSTLIPVDPDEFSYVPGDAVSVQIVNQYNNQLIATTRLNINTQYSVDKHNSKWSMTTLPTSTTFDYTNSTSVPVVLSIFSDEETISDEIAPNAKFTTPPMDPLAVVVVTAHADISPVFLPYSSTMSYSIVIDANNNISLTAQNDSSSSIKNNSGWPMLIRIAGYNEQGVIEDKELKDNESYTPKAPETATNVMILPLVDNYSNKPATIKSSTIRNNKGQLSL